MILACFLSAAAVMSGDVLFFRLSFSVMAVFYL